MDAVRAGRRRAHAVVGLLLVVAAFTATAPGASAGEITRRERMLMLHNDARVNRDRDALRMNDLLSRYAKRHSEAMARQGTIFHSDTGALVHALGDLEWEIGGENVGVGTSVEALNAAFLASPPHRHNILSTAFDHAAVGIVRADDRLWVTVIFYG